MAFRKRSNFKRSFTRRVSPTKMLSRRFKNGTFLRVAKEWSFVGFQARSSEDFQDPLVSWVVPIVNEGDWTSLSESAVGQFRSGVRHIRTRLYCEVDETYFTIQPTDPGGFGLASTISALEFCVFKSAEEEVHSVVHDPGSQEPSVVVPDVADFTTWPPGFLTRDPFLWSINEDRMMYGQLGWSHVNNEMVVQSFDEVVGVQQTLEYFQFRQLTMSRTINIGKLRKLNSSDAIFLAFSPIGINGWDPSVADEIGLNSKQLFIRQESWLWVP